MGGIDDGGIEHLARAVHHCDLAAHAVSRIQSHRDEALDGRLHEKGLQVERELTDGALARRFGERGAHLAFHRRGDQAVIRVRRGVFHERRGSALLFEYAAVHACQRRVTADDDGDL